jgi:ADP-ribose pyrophosphatase
MDYRYELLDSELCYQGFFRLQRHHLRHMQFAGGWSPTITRELLHRGHAAAALLYDPKIDAVVLIEQFRIGAIEHPGGPWLTELVAGYIEAGESAEDVVRREVLEEAGCRVEEILPIHSYLVSPGGSVERMSLFCARVQAPADGSIHGLAEEGEDIRVRVLSVDDALQRLHDGTIVSATPIIALQWLELYREELARRWD